MAQHLITIGADLSLRCKWTDMSALHYAAYFDVGPVLTTLLRKTKVSMPKPMETPWPKR